MGGEGGRKEAEEGIGIQRHRATRTARVVGDGRALATVDATPARWIERRKPDGMRTRVNGECQLAALVRQLAAGSNHSGGCSLRFNISSTQSAESMEDCTKLLLYCVLNNILTVNIIKTINIRSMFVNIFIIIC